jgi:hypothetical protein
MSDVLTDIRRDISARLEELRPAVTEYARLQEAQAALTSTESTAGRRPASRTSNARTAGKLGRAGAQRRNAQSVKAESVAAR